MNDIMRKSEEDRAIQNMLNRARSPAAKEAITIAVDLADRIIFHAQVRKNGKEMMKPFEDDEW